MYKKNLHAVLSCTVLSLLLINGQKANAARLIHLQGDSLSYFQTFFLNQTMQSQASNTAKAKSALLKALQGVEVQEVSKEADFKHTLHVRWAEKYLHYPVIGAEFIIHIPEANVNQNVSSLIMTKKKTRMDGSFYDHLSVDLGVPSSMVNSITQAENAARSAIHAYQAKNLWVHDHDIQRLQKNLAVYVDAHQKAHWVYEVNFYVPGLYRKLPAEMHYILDAISFSPYSIWNGIQTEEREEKGGGFGGNTKIGKIVYDGLTVHLPSLDITRDSTTGLCTLYNSRVIVKDQRTKDKFKFSCQFKDHAHNNVYWRTTFDQVNGAYSPSDDALFFGDVISKMYLNWYHLPPLAKKKQPLPLTMVVHLDLDNAFWDPSTQTMNFGDGDQKIFFPLTSLGVAAHEITHGFTTQHSALVYKDQSGGINEAFSDMAAMSAEYYVSAKNTWKLGEDVIKVPNVALRYFDRPSKDCKKGNKPGEFCSIDTAAQYYAGLNVHFSSGVYNRAFYLLATSPGWNTRKAFEVMLQANAYYWVPNTNFVSGACGVIDATRDYGYSVKTVQEAFRQVGIDTTSC